MRFLFVYDEFGLQGVIGGIDTLMARMAKWLLRNGHEVSLILRHSGPVERLMPGEMNIIEIGNNYDFLCYPFMVGKIWPKINIQKPDVIKAFSGKGFWIASLLSNYLGENVKSIIGFYDPNAVKPDRSKWYGNLYSRFFVRHVQRNVPKQNRFFMSMDMLKKFQTVYGEKEGGVIWYLPVDGTKYNDIERRPIWGKIVSVGRLSPMKGYNYYMIDVIKYLLNKGYSVTWTVYGDGPLHEEMKKRIFDDGLDDRVFFAGGLDYSKFKEAMIDVYIFVGMGTAIVESAFCKVPNVVALAYDVIGNTYGPLYSFPPGNIGELIDDRPVVLVKYELERLLKLSSEEYDNEAEAVKSYANMYNIDERMKDFVQYVTAAQPIRSDQFMEIAYYLYALLKRPSEFFSVFRMILAGCYRHLL